MSVLQARKAGFPLMNLVRFKGVPILKLLQLEEKLLRTSSDNWCIINDGTNAPNIVMGLSGKASELLELGPVLEDRVPVIRRFTGGGTVVVDPGTIFVTLICNKNAVPDYVFGNRKFGGNAQSITRKRWIHHTSFLWDFEGKNMGYLKLPQKAPEYRLVRM
ncbi:hypothetical protein U1Q18_020467 [Sarracenia purpurea var. burkii]